jgi:transcription termination/antitermination protein NusA
MFDRHKTDLVPSSEPQNLSEKIDGNFDAKRKELGVENGLRDIPGVTTLMLVAFGERGIKSIEYLADCATDDLDGWSEFKDGKAVRHTGILDHFRVSRQDCEAMIINARTKAGWFK